MGNMQGAKEPVAELKAAHARTSRKKSTRRADEPVEFHVWAHVEGVDEDGDMIEGDSHFEPRKLATFETRERAEECVDVIEAAGDRIRTLEAALREAENVLETARLYFPGPTEHPDKRSLLNVLENSVKPALASAKGG